MRKNLSILAAATALFAAMLVAATTTAAHASGITLTEGYAKWHHTGHSITVTFGFISIYGEPKTIDYVDLECDPADDSYWDRSSSGVNIDGLGLNWGGLNSDTGDWNVHNSMANGGNIHDCSHTVSWAANDGTQTDSNHHPRIRYHFTTFYQGGNNVSPTFALDMYGTGGQGCLSNMLNGAGTLDPCVIIETIPIG